MRRRLWKLETRRAGLPSFTWGITAMVARAVERFGSAALKEEVLPGVLSGHTRLCLGLTEPEGGSDVATCKTKAVRDGESWIINGSKMFTTGAHNCRYVFLTTNTDPSASKHKSLTMFMVPLASVGVDIQGIRTVDGDRTNIVYYGDVRVEDRYRLGEVNGGWTVLRSALDAEHGVVESANVGLDDLSAMSEHSCLTAVAVDQVAAATAVPDRNGFRRLDDDAVKYRLGRSFARVEATLSTTGAFGRVAIAENMRIVAEDLMDILGACRKPARRGYWSCGPRGGVLVSASRADGNIRRHRRSVPEHDRSAHAGPRPAGLTRMPEPVRCTVANQYPTRHPPENAAARPDAIDQHFIHHHLRRGRPNGPL